MKYTAQLFCLLLLPISIFILSLYVLPKIAVKRTRLIAQVKIEARQEDSRIKKLRDYLQSKNSPIADEAEDIISVADQWGLDYRLFVGISNAESSFCKRSPEGSHNCWGFACFDNQPCHYFKTYKEALESLAGTITNHYAYTDYNRTGSLSDLSKVYLTGNKKRWEGNVQSVINDLN